MKTPSLAVAAAALLACVATAQPTGNPKGTRAPPVSDSAKRPASRTPAGATDPAETGKIGPDKGPVDARTAASRGNRTAEPKAQPRGAANPQARPAPP